MPGPEDNIRPSGPVGPQPNATPSQPTFGALQGAMPKMPQQTDAAGPTFGQLTGQSQNPAPKEPPPPQAEQDPNAVSEISDSDLDKQLQQFSSTQTGKEKSALEKAGAHDDLDAQLSKFGSKYGTETQSSTFDEDKKIVDPQRPGESTIDYMKRSLTAAWGSARAGLGETPEKQKAAWASVYGADNVKVRAGKIYVKPDGSDSFRKVDNKQWDTMTDFVVHHMLDAIPMAVNGITQAGTELATDGAAIPAARAAGGAADYATRFGMQKAIDQFSDEPQVTGSAADQAGQLAAGVGLNASTNVVAGKALDTAVGGVKYLSDTAAAKWGMEKFQDLLSPVKQAQVKGSDILTSMERFIGRIQNMSKVGQPLNKSLNPTIGQSVSNAVDTIAKNFGEQIGAINDKAIDLAKSQGKRIIPSNLQGELKKILSNEGVAFDTEGRAVEPVAERGKQYFGSFDGMKTAKEMAGFYNKTLDAMPKAIDPNDLTTAIPQPGANVENFLQDIKALKERSEFSDTGPNLSDAERAAYARLHHAAGEDRNQLFDQVFSDGNAPEAQTWKNTFQNYQDNIGAVKQVQGAIRDDAQRDLLVKSLYTQNPGPKQLTTLRNLKQVLGEKSPEWNMFRGEILNNMVNDSMDQTTNVLNATGLLSKLNKMDPSIADALMSKQEQGDFKVIAAKASEIAKSSGILSGFQQSTIDKTAALASKMPGTKGISFIYKVFGGNKAAMDFAIDNSFLNAARQAEGRTEQIAILAQRNNFEKALGRMTVGNVVKNGKLVPTYLVNPAKIGATVSGAALGAQALTNASAPPLADSPDEPSQAVNQ